MLQIPETESFLSPLPSVSNTAASFIWWVITQEEAITMSRKLFQDYIMNNTLIMDLTCPTFE